MHYRRKTLLLVFVQLADLLVVGLSFVTAIALASQGAENFGWIDVLSIRISVLNGLALAAYLAFWHLCLRSAGLYESYRLAGPSREFRDLSVATVVAAAPVLPVGLLFDYSFATAPFLLAYFAMALLALMAERSALRIVARELRRRGRNLKNVLIVGDPGPAEELTEHLNSSDELGYQVRGVLGFEHSLFSNGHQRNGDGWAVSLQKRLAEEQVDEVFVAVPLAGANGSVRDVIAMCEEQGIAVRVFASVADLAWGRAVLDQVKDQPVITITSGYPGAVFYPIKRAIDLFVAATALVVLAPGFAAVALAIKFDSRGPVFFKQERVGQNRRRFMVYKFRTMVENADQLQYTLERRNEAKGPVFKIADDPRVTRVGRFLRRYSIDEFPQLFNVLMGEMSLVGPRPLPLRDVEQIVVAWHKRRFSVRPGITCLWQIRSRKPVFDEWIKADMEYIDNWSLGLDVKILTATIPAVISGNGAH